jgi:hypothetical protein
VPSASPPLARSAAVAACVCLLGAGAAGCSTTQEKAEIQQAKAAHILKARAARERARKRHESAHKRHHSHVDGPKTQGGLEKSAHQQSGGGEG